MKSLQISRRVAFGLCLALSGCGGAAYTVLERQTEGPEGMVVKIKVDVAADATPAQMEGWCSGITQSESEGKVVTVEFFEVGNIKRQKAMCVNGKMFVS